MWSGGTRGDRVALPTVNLDSSELGATERDAPDLLPSIIGPSDASHALVVDWAPHILVSPTESTHVQHNARRDTDSEHDGAARSVASTHEAELAAGERIYCAQRRSAYVNIL
jgi:hypothetical protein